MPEGALRDRAKIFLFMALLGLWGIGVTEEETIGIIMGII